MLKFVINQYLELKLEKNKTNIYVNNHLFVQCKHLLFDLSVEGMEKLKDIKSIDDAFEILPESYEFSELKKMKIPPDIEFWGHCSNLQAWYENKYDPHLLHSNLAFPLLRKLTKAGDILAEKVFKEEIAKKFESGCLWNIQFIVYNNYLDLLNKVELKTLFEQSSLNLVENVLNQLINLMVSHLTNFKRIRELIDLILFIDLRFNRTFLFQISEKYPQDNKEKFIKTVLLHLNYKEFNNFTIPYGRYFNYFERFITYLFENYPCFNELLTFIDSGYFHSSYSLEERLSYGTFWFQ